MCFLWVKGRIRKKKRMVLPKGPLAPFSLSFLCLVFWCGLVYSSLLDLSWLLVPASYKLSLIFSRLVDSWIVTVDVKFLNGFLFIVLYSYVRSSCNLAIFVNYSGNSHVLVVLDV